jgi:hypothetical protein
MAKKQKRTKPSQGFTLKGTKNTYYRSKITANFISHDHDTILPIYNHDHKYFTPSFIIPKIYQKN